MLKFCTNQKQNFNVLQTCQPRICFKNSKDNVLAFHTLIRCIMPMLCALGKEMHVTALTFLWDTPISWVIFRHFFCILFIHPNVSKQKDKDYLFSTCTFFTKNVNFRISQIKETSEPGIKDISFPLIFLEVHRSFEDHFPWIKSWDSI